MDVERVHLGRVSERAQARRGTEVAGRENGVSMGVDPGPRIKKSARHDFGNGAIVPGTDIEEEVAILGDDVNERLDNVFAGEVLVVWGLIVETEGEGIHAPIRLPLGIYGAGVRGIFRGREVSSDAAAVVECDLPAFLPGPIQPLRREQRRVVGPADITPHDLRLVVISQDFHLRKLEIHHEVVHSYVARVRNLVASVRVGWRSARETVDSHPSIFLIAGMIPFGHAEVSATPNVWMIFFGGCQKLLDEVTLGAVVDGCSFCDIARDVE